jgi:hypothetical protein
MTEWQPIETAPKDSPAILPVVWLVMDMASRAIADPVDRLRAITFSASAGGGEIHSPRMFVACWVGHRYLLRGKDRFLNCVSRVGHDRPPYCHSTGFGSLCRISTSAISKSSRMIPAESLLERISPGKSSEHTRKPPSSRGINLAVNSRGIMPVSLIGGSKSCNAGMSCTARDRCRKPCRSTRTT